MTAFTRQALEHFETHHGIATRADLVAAGHTDHDIRRLVDAGNLERVLHGAYRLPAVPFDELARCVAVCAAHPDVAIAGPTAGRIWGFRRLPRDGRIHVVGPKASHPTIAPWVVTYRTEAIHDTDLVRRRDGITVTSRPRTALDLTRYVTRGDLVSIIEQTMHDGGHRDDEMRDVAIDWLTKGRPWVRRYLLALDGRLRGGPAESHGEVRLGDALAAAGLPAIERQHCVDLPGYGPARFDLAVPERRLAIEIDLHPTHHETAGRERDARRDRAATSIGWLVARVVQDDFDAFDDLVRRLAALAHSRPRVR